MRTIRSQTSIIEREGILAALLTIPSVIWIIGIVGYPILLVLWMSLHQQFTIEANPPFVGLSNYIGILSSDIFWESAQRTLIWTISNLLVIVPLGVGLASLLNTRFYGQRFARTWMLLPWMFPIIVTILMWRWILDPIAGILNYLMLKLNLVNQPISFFATSEAAMFSIVLVNSWRWIPFFSVVTLAAMQTIPQDLYEAARVDGARSWQLFRHITLPLVLPTISSTTFILTMWLFNMFPPIWLMTQGGPGDATTTLPILIYRQGIQQFRMSDAATISVLLLILFVLPAAVIYVRTFGRKTIEE